MRRTIATYAVAAAVGATALVGITGSPAYAANCRTGKIATQRYGGYSVCTDIAHRVALYCETQQGERVEFGPWRNPGQRSEAICPHATQSFTVWYDTPE
jgi:hypothetical protein